MFAWNDTIKVSGSWYRPVANPMCRSLSVCLSVRGVYCGKTAHWIWMSFGVVNAVDRGTGVLDKGRRGMADLRVNVGNPIVTKGTLWLGYSLP